MFIGDVVRNAISRIGMAGLILIVSMVIFAFLAGGVVVHRLGTSPTATVEQPDQGAKNHGQSKPKHTNNGHGNANKSINSDENEND